MSIASRITSIEGHISDIYDSVELTGVDTTDIDKNLVNVPNTLKEGYVDIINNGTDTLYNNFPKVSGEGTSLTLNNTYQAPMRNNLKGNTSQTGTPTPTSPIPVNVVSGDNDIVVNGVNLLNPNDCYLFNSTKYIGTPNYATKGTIVVEPNTTYSFINDNTLDIPDFNIWEYDANNSNKTTATKTKTTSGDFRLLTFTTKNTTKYISFYEGGYVAYNSVNEMVDTIKLMLVKGNSVPTSLSEYEPYQGNTYNIDLPVENLLYVNVQTRTHNGITFTVNSDGSVTLQGTSTDMAYVNLYINESQNLISDTSKTYVFSRGTTNDNVGVGIYEYVNGWVYRVVTYTNSATYTPTGNSTGQIFRLFVKNGVTISTPLTVYPMLEVGTKANTFVPYGTTPIELCKIGNYQDYFYKDSDKWYLHKEIGKVVLNGSDDENWRLITANVGNQYLCEVLTNNISRSVLTQYFTPQITGGWTDLPNQKIMVHPSSFYIFRIRYDEITNVTDFKTWLSTHNTNIYYVLATPTNTEITDTTLINQLEEFYQAQSKNNQTNISQINNDLGFIISASALKKG